MQPEYRHLVKEPTQPQIHENNTDHAVFWTLCPDCVNSKAKPFVHIHIQDITRDRPSIGTDYALMNDGQHKREYQTTTGMPLVEQYFKVVHSTNDRSVCERMSKPNANTSWIRLGCEHEKLVWLGRVLS